MKKLMPGKIALYSLRLLKGEIVEEVSEIGCIFKLTPMGRG
ncbi:hypothetical protein M899_0519 [Bacteriovorax sp. BSW11_IV]|nr:hypothetical protein M899_0519 [Bacteriovorax sp. BSW11_IV]